ncbi:TetR/AcrR family transcriptional regulator [Sphingobium lactosutens]|uniref:TetR/AcrR family transcriptional regulator n=1 Tax=Sphingobium lactosutens TaxID=522773 RepID=UPI0015BC3719|nr:TetR/AcrR family transcriptional regulator [Sphingobium lactosutens]
MLSAPAPAKRGRRGALNRQKILEACIACINRNGYSATSVEAVMAEAGLSRGSVLLQFPTRLHLTLATAEFAMAEMLKNSEALGATIADPVERFCRFADIVWDVHRTPPSIALTDILLASRWDQDLAAGLKPLAEEAERHVDERFTEVAAQAGIKNIESVVLHGRVLNASVRGMTIDLAFNPSREVILLALETLKRDYEAFCRQLVETA